MLKQKGIDLVCGMEINVEGKVETVEYEGETYYFCSPSCRTHFEQDPKKYIGE